MREEPDFRVEARNTAAVAVTWAGQQRAVGGGASVTLPAVYEQLCTEHVLVIEWLDGVSLRAAAQLIDDRGLDRAALSRALLRSMVYQITEGSVFHADPHPGNVLLVTDGRVAMLDFGSVGRLDTRQRLALQDLLLALGRGDPAAFRDALLELVTRAEEIDELLLERALGQFMARHLTGGTAATPRCSPTCSGGPKVAPTVSLYQIIGYNLLIVAAILVLRVLFTIFRNG
jgi:ubiquinone biosynthesis protein